MFIFRPHIFSLVQMQEDPCGKVKHRQAWQKSELGRDGAMELLGFTGSGRLAATTISPDARRSQVGPES